MENIKHNFSIKDLENLSGVKAHTIRIWEKRYNVLNPDRTSTNIRSYGLDSLQKILNISLLNNYGYKISKISKLSDKEIRALIKNIAISPSKYAYAVSSFKIAMYNFDDRIFFETYNLLKKQISFSEIFIEVFIPLLNEIGVLWQTDTIRPTHEHFISHLIKQQIFLQIAETQPKAEPKKDSTYVLFLPDNEIHELGLLYLHYELNKRNHHCIFLGPSVPFADMKYLLPLHDNIIFVTYLTVRPPDVSSFIEDFNKNLCEDKPRELLLFGQKIQELENPEAMPHIKAYSKLTDFTDFL